MGGRGSGPWPCSLLRGHPPCQPVFLLPFHWGTTWVTGPSHLPPSCGAARCLARARAVLSATCRRLLPEVGVVSLQSPLHLCHVIHVDCPVNPDGDYVKGTLGTTKLVAMLIKFQHHPDSSWAMILVHGHWYGSCILIKLAKLRTKKSGWILLCLPLAHLPLVCGDSEWPSHILVFLRIYFSFHLTWYN